MKSEVSCLVSEHVNAKKKFNLTISNDCVATRYWLTQSDKLANSDELRSEANW